MVTIDETFLVPRPLQRMSFAKEAARANLAQRLEKDFQFDAQAAALLSRIVVDPTAVRHQFQAPLTKRFPGGTAYYISADVYTPGVVASLMNPRESERRPYPVAALPGESVWAPLTLDSKTVNPPILQLVANSRSHVEHIANRSAKYLRERVDLREEIKLDGVLEPVMIVLVDIAHRDGTPSLTVAMAIDGSTRTTITHDLTGVDPVEAIYDTPNESARAWGRRIGEILAVQDKPDLELSEQQRTRHRAVTYQARILIGIEPVRDGEPIDVVTACRAIVGGIHVGHPQEWPQGSELDEIAEAVLDRLTREGRITQEGREYLAGLIDPKDLQQRGFSPHPDMRAIQIVCAMYDRHNQRLISIAYRNLAGKTRLRKDDQSAIAAELILRAVRVRLSDSDIKAIRSALQRTISLTELFSNPWHVSGRSPDDLLEDALIELEKGDGTINEARLELAVLGIYWLVTTQALKRDTPRGDDFRAGESVIRAMLQSAYGLRQLHRAVIEGRANPRGNGAITAIDAAGEPLLLAAGGTMLVDDAWLRRTFQPPGVSAGISPLDDPAMRLSRGIQDLQTKVDAVYDLVRSLNRDARDQGGIAPPIARIMQGKLQKAGQQIGTWGMFSAAKQGSFDFDELDLRGDSDGVTP